MKKILVPTDFSANASSGVRLAIQWASQQPLHLVFVHVLHVLRPTQWTEAYFDKYVSEREADCRSKIKKQVIEAYEKMQIAPGKYSVLVLRGMAADLTLLDYTEKNAGFDCICMSTRGAGKIKKILGTNTGNLISKSTVPVLAVPKNYRVHAFSSILYATDFKNFGAEMPKVVQVARPLKIVPEVLHFVWPNQLVLDQPTMETTFKKQFKYPLHLHLVKADAGFSMVAQLQKQIKKLRPSLVIMFTQQHRTFFQKLFLSSKSEELSFEAKVPLLVFNKE